ncbi:MAG: 50S ribosomal protein P1 [Candidatus Nanoarchaeia archaeon]|nr:50S ribosomal protein P1 [Candidatus Haiyanarchaeum thermophilum]MCW1302831.1 50S ribosomal protein P1 [Candidatus Haiyanarchaeum thermophilum]MCW1303512.1 50S ribosomal protein P1 [Candidatus Haiyanarchaeum thermophilum]MCW1306692.1 50S ribosomal protein P1 [Candidatus Haiyanarchaeum thermophilum]MCW1307352.1 50S ribosomal protein P1 [Candidatus Haiyanarchaeum thermophilum]
MEYIYAALLLHKTGKKVDEESLRRVLEAAGAKVDEARIKALVASLEGVNIDEVLAQALPVSTAPSTPSPQAAESKPKEEEKKEKKISEEEAATGLSALFA